MFINPELIQWSGLVSVYENVLKHGTDDSPPTDVFNPNTEEGQARWKELKNKVVEHNIRVMAKYYTRITLGRMAQLLDLPIEETEEFLSNLVVKKTIEAKTDRPDGIVCFTRSKDPDDILNEWSNHLNSLMQLVNKTTHLINKEEMIHKHLLSVRE